MVFILLGFGSMGPGGQVWSEVLMSTQQQRQESLGLFCFYQSKCILSYPTGSGAHFWIKVAGEHLPLILFSPVILLTCKKKTGSDDEVLEVKGR